MSLLVERYCLAGSYKYVEFEFLYGLQASKAQAVLQIRVGMFDFKDLKIIVPQILHSVGLCDHLTKSAPKFCFFHFSFWFGLCSVLVN